ncbi:TFIIB-type zinc ribbon-containing protein [Cellulomonas xiejunii]|uniref:TFIIB-type zinc ribbon-containing protein n=1 Tax=Cellulomonas xiejunii TaxID=2968083 RepID=A0ABY5KQF2_9CELL|nr:TFIIB-type zinc ribbon-containing protein [Cellulomonas xiejunii]MCC2322684.1 TFIIB-type zinc ribbon-containing protein [Cellulomonas xiejunii]UUI72721.1 TFIIB-type zinc ribbon-containing protein [Cellulomonas xiejunii]
MSDLQAPRPVPDGERVVRTGGDGTDGIVRCERCGASEATLNVATGMLRCNFCRFEWSTQNALQAFDLDGAIGDLSGVVVGSGTADVTADPAVTLRCTACGADVVVDTTAAVHARCHWCRNTLSLTEQVPNGAVPDMLLPFSVSKDEAVKHVAEFVRKRTFYAHPRFRAEFQPENVMGVYLPYMVVDVNAHATVTGEGEHQTRSYTVQVRDSEGKTRSERRYDADVYDVRRSFDLHVDDLTVESSAQRLDRDTARTSNNVINTILPFDVENGVLYDPRYLQGFTSERRDVDVGVLRPAVLGQVSDIARWRVDETIAFYDRGVRWDTTDVDVRGERWVSAYLPVWLYSYLQTKRDGSTLLHYVAVNGRTGETMGSVPLNVPRLALVASVVEVFGAAAAAVLWVLT